jgi:hypothetical protein
MAEPFAEAANLWNLDALWADLEQIKQASLTRREKEYFRGLLLGKQLQDIATTLHKTYGTVRGDLVLIYRDIETLRGLPEKSVNFSKVIPVLKEAGYQRSHIDRPNIEEKCQKALLQPGSLIRIKAPQQMGKTLLLNKVLAYGQRQRYQTVRLDFHLFDRATFQNLDTFLRCFCSYIGLRLGLPDKVSERWTPIFGSNINCLAYFEEYLLPSIDSALVLGLDNVDLIFEHEEIAADFLGLVRAWYEEGQNRAIWQRLRLILVHSTEVYIPLDRNQSPFNVGLPIDLPELEPSEVWEFARSRQLEWQSDQVALLTQLVGGHPALVKDALDYIAESGSTLERLVQRAPTESGPFGKHLQRHLLNLEKYPDLAKAMQAVVVVSRPISINTAHAFKLQSMGLVYREGNQVRVRNDLYQRYFYDRLNQENTCDE